MKQIAFAALLMSPALAIKVNHGHHHRHHKVNAYDHWNLENHQNSNATEYTDDEPKSYRVNGTLAQGKPESNEKEGSSFVQYDHWTFANHRASNATEWTDDEPKAYRVEPANLTLFMYPHWNDENHAASNMTEWVEAEPKAYRVEPHTLSQRYDHWDLENHHSSNEA